jgi:hypothetical protein
MLSTSRAQAAGDAARLFAKANMALFAAPVDSAAARRIKAMFRMGLPV